jgi:hypothetical protein
VTCFLWRTISAAARRPSGVLALLVAPAFLPAFGICVYGVLFVAVVLSA